MFYLPGEPPGEGFLPLKINLAYLCPQCGDLWARVVSPEGKYWNPVAWPCAKHDNSWEIPNGVLCPGYAQTPEVSDLPHSLLRREFILWSDYHARK
jgi:hypothetical protein